MTLTVLQILNAVPVINSLCAQQLPALAALRVFRIAQKLAPEVASASKVRDGLFTDVNSTPVVGGKGTRKLKPECVDEFIANPLFAEKIEIEGLKPLTIGDLSAAKISPTEISQLGLLFTDTEENK